MAPIASVGGSTAYQPVTQASPVSAPPPRKESGNDHDKDDGGTSIQAQAATGYTTATRGSLLNVTA